MRFFFLCCLTGTNICRGTDRYPICYHLYPKLEITVSIVSVLNCMCFLFHSSDLNSYLNTYMNVPCNFTLETYACAQVTNLRVNIEIQGFTFLRTASMQHALLVIWLNLLNYHLLSHTYSWRTSQPISWCLFWSVIYLETAATPMCCGRCFWLSYPLSWTQLWTS